MEGIDRNSQCVFFEDPGNINEDQAVGVLLLQPVGPFSGEKHPLASGIDGEIIHHLRLVLRILFTSR